MNVSGVGSMRLGFSHGGELVNLWAPLLDYLGDVFFLENLIYQIPLMNQHLQYSHLQRWKNASNSWNQARHVDRTRSLSSSTKLAMKQLLSCSLCWPTSGRLRQCQKTVLAEMLMFYKKKCKNDRKNYRALGLLNHAYKVLSMLLLVYISPIHYTKTLRDIGWVP